MNKEILATIQYFKEREKPESIIIILDDENILKIISVFNLAVIESKKVIKLNKENDNILWSSMWNNFEINLNLLAVSADFGIELTRKLTQRLIINRLVYPDNSINKFCQQYLARKIVNILRDNT